MGKYKKINLMNLAKILHECDILDFMENKKPRKVLLLELDQGLCKAGDDTNGFGVFVVHRSFFDVESATWKENDVNKPGTYLLVGCSERDGKYSAYAGKSAEAGVLTRLYRHHKEANNGEKIWTIAIVLIKVSPSDFTQDECSFLEWEFYDALKENKCIKLLNKNRPSGDPMIHRTKSKQMPDLAKFALNIAALHGLPCIDDYDIQWLLPSENHQNPILKEFLKVAEKADRLMCGQHDGINADIRIDGPSNIIHLELDAKSQGKFSSLTKAMKTIFPSCFEKAWDFWKIKSTGQTARERYGELM